MTVCEEGVGGFKEMTTTGRQLLRVGSVSAAQHPPDYWGTD